MNTSPSLSLKKTEAVVVEMLKTRMVKELVDKEEKRRRREEKEEEVFGEWMTRVTHRRREGEREEEEEGQKGGEILQ